MYHLFHGGYLSQWYPCHFMIDGITYNCAEQYMMAQKAKIFNDQEILQKILDAPHPREQKTLGRQIKNFDVDIWNAVAKKVVYKGNMAKFISHTNIYNRLMQTFPAILVEAAPYDKIWGIGLDIDDPRAKDCKQWLGTNWLGEVLTEVRNTLHRMEIFNG